MSIISFDSACFNFNHDLTLGRNQLARLAELTWPRHRDKRVYLLVKSSSSAKTSEQSGRDKLLIIKKESIDEGPSRRRAVKKGRVHTMECKRVEEVGWWVTWRENDRSTTLADLKAVGLESSGSLLKKLKFDDEIIIERENGPDPRDDSMITRNERTRPCQWTSLLPFAPWSREKGAATCRETWIIVNLFALRDVMDININVAWNVRKIWS